MTLTALQLRDVLLYDQLGASTITIGERICVHQFIGQGIAMPPLLQYKVRKINERLQLVNWQAPIVRINELYQTEIINKS